MMKFLCCTICRTRITPKNRVHIKNTFIREDMPLIDFIINMVKQSPSEMNLVPIITDFICRKCHRLLTELHDLLQKSKEIQDHLIKNLLDTHNALEANANKVTTETTKGVHCSPEANEDNQLHTDVFIIKSQTREEVQSLSVENNTQPKPQESLEEEVLIPSPKEDEAKNLQEEEITIGPNVSISKKFKYSCKVCSKEYTVKRQLIKHLITHGINSYKCKVCSKTFTQNIGLRRHMSIHTGILAHECEICKKKFKFRSSLVAHNVTHSETTLCQCDICGISLASGTNLKRHLRTHTREKSFGCQICGRMFAEKYNLNAHMKLHGKPNTKNQQASS